MIDWYAVSVWRQENISGSLKNSRHVNMIFYPAERVAVIVLHCTVQIKIESVKSVAEIRLLYLKIGQMRVTHCSLCSLVSSPDAHV